MKELLKLQKVFNENTAKIMHFQFDVENYYGKLFIDKEEITQGDNIHLLNRVKQIIREYGLQWE